VVSSTLLLAGCGEDAVEGPTGGTGDNPAVLVVGQAYTPEEYLTYVRVFPDVPEGDVDFRGFREFGNANVYGEYGDVFVEQDGQVTRFSVNADLELVEGLTLSWEAYGITSANASYSVFVSPQRAYTFAPDLGVVLVWDPEAMVLSGTIPLDFPARPGSMETWAYDGYRIGDKVVWNVFSGDFDAIRQYPAVTLAMADADGDAPVRFVEDARCLGGGPSRVAEDGTYYVQAGAYYGYFLAYGERTNASTCMLAMKDGETELDPDFMVDYQGLTGSAVTDLWLPLGGDSYVVRAWDPEVPFPENPDDFWDNPALHSLLVDTKAGTSQPYPDLEGAIGIDGTARTVDGISYYQFNQNGYDVGGEVDVVALHPAGIRPKFHLHGFLLGLERLR